MKIVFALLLLGMFLGGSPRVQAHPVYFGSDSYSQSRTTHRVSAPVSKAEPSALLFLGTTMVGIGVLWRKIGFN
jgi:hypothetical protein